MILSNILLYTFIVLYLILLKFSYILSQSHGIVKYICFLRRKKEAARAGNVGAIDFWRRAKYNICAGMKSFSRRRVTFYLRFALLL